MTLVDVIDETPAVSHDRPVDYAPLVSVVAAPAVELDGLEKSFSGRKVLDGLSLAVRKGETLAVIGGSGTGKSVTLKHIVGLMKPDRGTIRIDGVDITAPRNGELEEARGKIGFCFQGSALLNSMSVFDNVALPLREHDRLPEGEVKSRVDETLKLVGLSDAGDKFPAEISGGMKKRAGLARAIIRRPSIVLYDEPTAGLDPVIASTINDLILDMQDKLGVTSILVTHDMSSVWKTADRIAMLLKGRVHKEGSPEDFKSSDDPVVKQFIFGESEGPLTRDRA